MKDGQALEALLGEDMLEIDTLVVKGSLKHQEILMMRQCVHIGKLRVIDISGCTVESNSLPKMRLPTIGFRHGSTLSHCQRHCRP